MLPLRISEKQEILKELNSGRSRKSLILKYGVGAATLRDITMSKVWLNRFKEKDSIKRLKVCGEKLILLWFSLF